MTSVRHDRVRSELIGVDVGGTFADIVAVDPHGGTVRIHKVSSTPSNQAQGVLKGIMELCGNAAVAPSELLTARRSQRIRFSRATVAPVALVTTAGFRDTIEIGRCRRNVPDTMFNTSSSDRLPSYPAGFASRCVSGYGRRATPWFRSKRRT